MSLPDFGRDSSRPEAVIQVEGLSKKFRIHHNQPVRYATLRDTIRNGLLNLAHRARRGGSLLPRVEDFWALQDVSFDVSAGEVVGIIGRNGAGKSTLLKILARITPPTEGRIRLRGRVASLLEVGTGFHTELTGRENIYLNGAILGMSRREVASRFDEIVAFAGVEKFLDTPVKRYSSGMHARLAFAVAAHLEPEILIVDEVLAVGDVQFQEKCLERMGQVSRSGRTVLFVSHNMQAIRTLCSRCVLLSKGRLVADGDPVAMVKEYYRLNAETEALPAAAVCDPRFRHGNGWVRFTAVEVTDLTEKPRTEFEMGESIRFSLRFCVHKDVPNLHFVLAFYASQHNLHMSNISICISEGPVAAGRSGRLVFDVVNPGLRPGEFRLMYWLGDVHGTTAYDALKHLLDPLVIVTRKSFYELGFDPSMDGGYFDLPFGVRSVSLDASEQLRDTPLKVGP